MTDDPHPPHRCCECQDCKTYWAPVFAEHDAMQAFYNKLAAEQKPLPPEFAKVLSENLWDLYGDTVPPLATEQEEK